MKKFFSVALVASMTLQSFVFLTIFSQSVSAQEQSAEISNEEKQPDKLTNIGIIEMTKSGLSEAIIIAKINASQTNFDTSLSALQALKQAEISDAVILAMVKSSYPDVPKEEVLVESELSIPDGTEIQVELKNELSGQSAKVDDIVDFTVVDAIQVNGITVIDKGASASAKITNAKKAGYWGKSGKLEWAMTDVQTVSGTRIPVRFTKAVAGKSKGGTVAVGAVATTILLGPVGLLWGLKKGKKAVIAAGNKYSVYSNGDSTITVKTADVKPSL